MPTSYNNLANNKFNLHKNHHQAEEYSAKHTVQHYKLQAQIKKLQVQEMLEITRKITKFFKITLTTPLHQNTKNTNYNTKWQKTKISHFLVRHWKPPSSDDENTIISIHRLLLNYQWFILSAPFWSSILSPSSILIEHFRHQKHQSHHQFKACSSPRCRKKREKIKNLIMPKSFIAHSDIVVL